jgi:hypothetical protein
MNNDTETNCLYAILQTSGQFNPQSLIITPTTTQPFLFETNYIRNIKTNCLILYNTSANTRSILYYTDSFSVFDWNTLFTNSSVAVPFSDPHWNSFVDITNDCYADLIITNDQNQIEFWIYQSSISKFSLALLYNVTNLTSLSFVDVNYDGNLDLILANQSFISIYL